MSNQAWQTVSQIAVAVGIILTGLGGWGAYVFGQRVQRDKEARSAYTGDIKAREEVLLSSQSKVWPKLEMGSSGAIFVWSGPADTPFLRIGEDVHLTIVREDGQVKVSTGIRDKTGGLVAELVKNEWRVNPNNAFDRNYSADALEVQDSTGDIVLQVRALHDRIQLQAKFYDSTGFGLGFGQAVDPQTGKLSGMMTKAAPGQPLRLKIAPMFQYPSEKHLGELVVTGGGP